MSKDSKIPSDYEPDASPEPGAEGDRAAPEAGAEGDRATPEARTEGDRPAPEPARRRGMRELPEAMQALATGETDRLRRPRGPRNRLHDERERVAITGVNNRDARHVFDARVAELQHMSDTAARGDALLEALQLGLWRARNITGFDAFASDVVGIAPDQARALAQAAAARAEVPLEALPEAQAALWLRTESAMREHAPGGRVRLVGQGDAMTLELIVPAGAPHVAVAALSGVGRQAAGLGRHLEQGPRPPQRGDAREGAGERRFPSDADADASGRRPPPRRGAGPGQRGRDREDSPERGFPRRPFRRDDERQGHGKPRPFRRDDEQQGHGQPRPFRRDDERQGYGKPRPFRRDDEQQGHGRPRPFRRDDDRQDGNQPRPFRRGPRADQRSDDDGPRGRDRGPRRFGDNEAAGRGRGPKHFGGHSGGTKGGRAPKRGERGPHGGPGFRKGKPNKPRGGNQ